MTLQSSVVNINEKVVNDTALFVSLLRSQQAQTVNEALCDISQSLNRTAACLPSASLFSTLGQFCQLTSILWRCTCSTSVSCCRIKAKKKMLQMCSACGEAGLQSKVRVT